MATRKLEVVITGDSRSLEKSLNNVGTQSTGMASKFKKLAIAGGVVGGALAGVGVALGSTVKAAQESEKAQARLDQALKGAGLSMDQYGSRIQDSIEKTSRLAALDDEDLSDAFAKLVRTTGDVTKATEGMNLAADIARSRNVSLESATKAVEKAYNGSGAALARFGVSVAKSTSNVDAAKATIDSWRDSNNKLTDSEDTKAKALLDGAKALDKQATAGNALDEAQKKFAGGAEAYGKTSAAAQERVSVALENLQEIIGAKVLPVVAMLSEKLLQFVNWSIVNWPRFQAAVSDAVNKVIAAFDRFRPVLDAAWQQIQNLVRLVKAIFEGDWAEAWDAFKAVIEGGLKLAYELIKFNLGVFKDIAAKLGAAIVDGVKAGLVGIGTAAWNLINNIGEKIAEMPETIKGWGVSVATSIVNGLVNALVGIGTKAWEVINNIGSVLDDVRNQIIGWGRELATRIIKGLTDGLDGLGQSIWEKIKGAFDWVKSKIPSLPKLDVPFIGDAGDPNFNPFIVPPTGTMEPTTGSVNLMGARPEMMPFAQAAAGYGLAVTSGLRPGAITANGTLSDHAIGKALDVAGSSAAMAGFFRSLIGNPSVKQAFYDPLGSIFGGRQNPYVEGGHMDHVHVATYDKGGWLMPGLTLARNLTGRPERILGPHSRAAAPVINNFHFPNYSGDKRELMQLIRTEVQRTAARN